MPPCKPVDRIRQTYSDMRLELSQTLRQQMLYALGIVIMKGVSLFMLPFIAHQLSPAEFGTLEVLNSLNALGSVLVGLGLLNTMFRFVGFARSQAERKELVAEIFGLNLLVAGLLFVVGFPLAGWLSGLLPGQTDQYMVQLAIAMIALEGCIGIPLGWLRHAERVGLFFVLNTGKALLQAALVLLFLVQGRGIAGVLEAGLIAALALAVLLVIIQYRDSGIRLNPASYRKVLLYSIPLVGSGLLGFVLTGLDRWIIASEVGTAQMAQYALAAKFALLAAIMLQPFLMWWSPRRFSVLNEPDGARKVARLAAMGSAISLLIVVGVGLLSPLLIGLLFPADYAEAARFLPWLVLTVAIKDSAELLNLGCYTGDRTHTQFLINLAGGVAGLLAMLLLVPLWAAWGATWALLIAQTLRLLLYFVLSQRVLPLDYPLRALVGLAVLAIGLLWLGDSMAGWLSQALFALCAMLAMTGVAMRLRLIPSLPGQSLA